MKGMDVTESVAAAMNAAVEALSKVGVPTPNRWLRKVSEPQYGGDITTTLSYDLTFWFCGSPDEKYFITVTLIDKNNKPASEEWIPIHAIGVDEKTKAQCSFNFLNGRVTTHEGTVPYSIP